MSPSFKRELEPGKYFLQASYHLVDPGEHEYRKKVVAADEITFTVRELTKIEAEEYDVFLTAYANLFPFKVNNVRPPGDAKLLEQFMKDYPDSPYRFSAYTGLEDFYFNPKDTSKSYVFWKQAHAEGLYNQLCEEISDYHRDQNLGIPYKGRETSGGNRRIRRVA